MNAVRAHRLRGASGSIIKLSVLRPATGQTLEFALKRAKVEVHSVAQQSLDAGFGYLRITGFSETTAEDVAHAFVEHDDRRDELAAEQDARIRTLLSAHRFMIAYLLSFLATKRLTRTMTETTPGRQSELAVKAKIFAVGLLDMLIDLLVPTLVYLALAGPDGTRVEEHRFSGDRAAVTHAATERALGLLVEAAEALRQAR